MLPPTQPNSEQKLTEEELKSILLDLNVIIPQVLTLIGELGFRLDKIRN